jgi:hypothetical protein
MTDALLSELLIAVFAGLVALVIMRKNTPRPVELVLWIGLIWVCVLGVAGIHDKQARDLTNATFWGLTQIAGSLIAMGAQSAVQWMFDNRFVIADWGVLLVGVDLLALAFLTSRRQAAGWQPQVRMRDWMELPRLAEPKPAPATVSAVDDINRRFNLWAPVAAAAAITWTAFFLIWSGDVAVPTMGRKLKHAAATADGARRRVATADWHGLIERASVEPRRLKEQVVDIGDLSRRAADMRAKAATWLTDAGTTPEANWLGGFGVMPPHVVDGGIEADGTERDHRDKLAS